MTQTKETEITVLDYNELIDLSVNLNDRIARAFGSDAGCLGVLFVKNVPVLL